MNKRIFNIEMFVDNFDQSNMNCIGEIIGDAEIFMYEDYVSEVIVGNWKNGKKEKAFNVLKKYVSGITAKISTDNGRL